MTAVPPDPPYAGPGGRHRRLDPSLVVHLVLADGADVPLGLDVAVARSIAHLAGMLADW